MDTVLFDLGGVLVDWNPRYLYRPLFQGNDEAMEHFLATVCAPEWNHEMDAGKPFAVAVRERQALFPEHADLIALWKDGWEQMLREPIVESVAIRTELRNRGHRLLALTNWSSEKFPIARARFAFLSWFEDIVVSGDVKLAKPDRRIFELTIRRAALEPATTVYIDDNLPNIEAARPLGFHAVHFSTPAKLRAELTRLGLI